MGIEDFILGGAGLGLLYDKFTKDKKSDTQVANTTTNTTSPSLLENENVNVINPKVRLKHGGEVEVLKGHDYIKDLIK
jgi:hypothetical protein